jgi:hypothetical protein
LFSYRNLEFEVTAVKLALLAIAFGDCVQQPPHDERLRLLRAFMAISPKPECENGNM